MGINKVHAEDFSREIQTTNDIVEFKWDLPLFAYIQISIVKRFKKSSQILTILLGNTTFIVVRKKFSSWAKLEGYNFSGNYKRSIAQTNSQYLIYFTETLWTLCILITNIQSNEHICLHHDAL